MTKEQPRDDVNILHATKFYHPKVGGMERVVQQLAEGSTDSGFLTRVLATVPKGSGQEETINQVKVTKTSSLGKLFSVSLSPTYPAHLKRLQSQANLVHFHLPDPLAVSSHMIPDRQSPTTVATYHADIVKQDKLLKLYRPILDKFLSSMDHIFVTSPYLLNESEFLKGYRDKCEVVPLSIDVDEYGSYDGPEFDFDLDDEKPTLLFVGRLVYYKGIEYLIQAMTDVEADLLVVGDGALRSQLESLSERLGVSDKVRFLGRVGDRMLHYCYSTSDVFVFPSVASSEGFGIVQLEAMAYRTPVINTNLPSGVPWVSKDGETGLTVSPENSGELSKAINKLCSNSQLRTKFGKAARQRVETRFSQELMINDVVDRYEKLLG